jgi:hypothetical protein
VPIRRQIEKGTRQRPATRVEAPKPKPLRRRRLDELGDHGEEHVEGDAEEGRGDVGAEHGTVAELAEVDERRGAAQLQPHPERQGADGDDEAGEGGGGDPAPFVTLADRDHQGDDADTAEHRALDVERGAGAALARTDDEEGGDESDGAEDRGSRRRRGRWSVRRSGR